MSIIHVSANHGLFAGSFRITRPGVNVTERSEPASLFRLAFIRLICGYSVENVTKFLLLASHVGPRYFPIALIKFSRTGRSGESQRHLARVRSLLQQNVRDHPDDAGATFQLIEFFLQPIPPTGDEDPIQFIADKRLHAEFHTQFHHVSLDLDQATAHVTDLVSSEKDLQKFTD